MQLDITDEQIIALKAEAERDEDFEFAVECQQALMGNLELREHCAKVLKVYGIKENH